MGEPGLLRLAATTIRVILGWAFAGLGMLNLAMGRAGTGYLLFHVMLVVTALPLMGFGYLRRTPTRLAYGAGALVTVLGLAVSAVGWRGLPFAMAVAGRLDGVRLGADLVFWASAGFCVLTVITLLRPAAAAPQRPPAHATHAEERATEVPAPRDESVGGLP